MPLDRPVVFPLLPIVQTSEGPACGCSKGRECPSIGKHPAISWRELEVGAAVPRPEPGAGVGIRTGARPCGSGFFVVDIDGAAAAAAWVELGGSGPTYKVRTGRDGGGWQLYFQCPDFAVRNSRGELWHGPTGDGGIDIRGEGGMVVAAGSPHKSGCRYEVVEDLPPQPAPEWLLTWLRSRPAAAPAQTYDGDVSGPERVRRIELYRKYLETAQPCVEGAGGDGQLFRVCQYGAYDLALPTDDVLEAVREVYDPRCQPPWDDVLDDRVRHKCHSAKTTSTRPRQPVLTQAEEELLEGLLEPTAHPTPKPTEPNDPDPNCGFNIRWGGWDAPPVPPTYVVEGLLVYNTVSMIYADSGSIKTWIAIDIAAAVSSGTAWLDERAVMQGPVLYIDFEDGEDEFHRRVHMLRRGASLGNLAYMRSPPQLGEPSIWTQIAKLQQKQQLRLIVVDTLGGSTVGADENDRNAANMLIFAGNMAEVTKATVLVVHHANKSGSMRGTSAFKANVDTAFKLETVEDNEKHHRVILTCEKSGRKKTAPIRLELTDEGLRTFEPPAVGDDDEEGKVLTDEELRAKILLVLQGEPVSSKKKLRELVKSGANRVDTELAELIAKGEVAKTKEGFVVDNDGKRRERVKASVERFDYWASEAELARDAGVPTEFVHELKRQGWVSDKASGGDVLGFLWIKRREG